MNIILMIGKSEDKQKSSSKKWSKRALGMPYLGSHNFQIINLITYKELFTALIPFKMETLNRDEDLLAAQCESNTIDRAGDLKKNMAASRVSKDIIKQ